MCGRQTSVAAVGIVVLGVLIGSCKKDETTAPPSTGPSLIVGHSSLSLHPGDTASTTISGGTPPYAFVDKGDTTKVLPSLSDSSLTVHAVGVGSSTIIVGDNSSPALRGTINVVVSALPLIANPTAVSLAGLTPQSVTISTGTEPYSIFQPPAPGLATAQFVDPNLSTAVLVITGVSTATGSTSVIVRDASTPPRSVTVGISKVQ